MDADSSREGRLKDFIGQVHEALEKHLTSLEDIWQEIGFSEKQKLKRNEKALYHFNDLFKQMVSEEHELKCRTQKNVDVCSQELAQLCEELGLPNHEINENLSLLQREVELRSKVDELNKEKHERLKTLRKLRTEEQQYCERMKMPQHELNFVGCPTEIQIKELQQNITLLTAEFTKRFELFKKVQTSILRYWQDLEAEPDGELEAQLITDNADTEFVLSKSNLKYLEDAEGKLESRHRQLLGEIDELKEKAKALWNRLEVPKEEREAFLKQNMEYTPKVALTLRAEVERLQELKKQHMERFIESLRKELTALWDKCYYDESQRREFPQAFDDVFTEESLEAHEHHVQVMKNYYEENKELFNMVQKREGIWAKKLEFESRPTDFNRLNNRGGALLKEEKMRRAIEKELPKLEHDLVKKIETWEQEHETYFLFQGNRYVTYLTSQKDEYESEKIHKKQQKQKEKENVMKEEMVFGSKPKTPKKRPLPGTPSKVSVKMRKVDMSHCTSLTPSKFVHSSICPSPRSATTVGNRLAKKPPKALGTKLNKTARRLSKKAKRRSSRMALKNLLPSGVLNKTHTRDPMKADAGCTPKVQKSASRSSKEDSLVSYNEFAGGIVSPHCRSSFLSLETTREEKV